MAWRRYLPSAQFSVLAVSVILSIGLIYAADVVTRKAGPAQLAVAQTDNAAAAQNANWQKALDEVQAQSGASLPAPLNQQTLDTMLKEAKTSNVTETLGRTLFVNLSAAKSQGLGDDTPTQDSIISQALELVPQPKTKIYNTSDLTLTSDTKENEHTYGNLLTTTFAAYPGASAMQALTAIDTFLSGNNQTELAKLKPVEKEYRALTRALLALPVPKTISPLHILLVNDIARLADIFPLLEAFTNDPAKGLVGLKNFQSLNDETKRVLINIAQSFNKDGILFTSGEPGASWASVLSVQQ